MLQQGVNQQGVNQKPHNMPLKIESIKYQDVSCNLCSPVFVYNLCPTKASKLTGDVCHTVW